MEQRENELEKLEKLAESLTTMGNFTQIIRDSYTRLESEYKDINSRLARVNELLRNSLSERNRSTHYLNNILESLDSGVVVTDYSGIINVYNAAAEKLVGAKAARALGKHYKEQLPFGPDIENQMSKLGPGISISGEMVLGPAETRQIPVAYAVTRLGQLSGDERPGLVIILYNLTEIKRLEDDIKRISTLAALGEMAATVAHEIRNPLSGISGFTDLLLRDLPPNSENRRLVEKIREGVASLNATVDSLLDYTRSICPDISDVDVIPIVEGAVSDVKADRNTAEHEFEVRPRSRKLTARIDPQLFRMVVVNLLKNAIQANPHGAKIKVTVSKSKSGEFRLTVEDNGPGIPDEAFEKIFTPFFTTKANGTGLGLATVKKLTELHGGRVTARNRPDGGAAFVVEIPNQDSGDYDET